MVVTVDLAVAGSSSVTAQHISVSFGGVTALEEVSLHFEGPGIMGVVGPNGSGKSTLMGVLSGLVKPGRGTVRMNERDLTGRSALAFARSGMRRSFQATRLVPNLTLRDNMILGLGSLGPEERERAVSIAELFGIASELSRFPASVPAGVQRLVQVAAALLSRPRVILLDEPAAGLTDGECERLIEALAHTANQSLILLVEHNMQLVYELAARVVVLLNGRVAMDGAVDDVRRDSRFREAYLGQPASEAPRIPHE